VVGESKIPILDLAANYEELAKFILLRISPEFNEYGLDVTKFLVENISLPSEVEQMLDKRSSMGILGNLNQYAQFQAANAMEAAAKNPNGNASSGIEMGMGFAMAQKMGEAFNQRDQPHQIPPPIPGATQYFMAMNGQQQGPFTLSIIQEMIGQGKFTKETLVWKQGLANWIKASDAEDLGPMFANVPPPLPAV
jgi:membrane protease subunit (stomatin/prohibitin family)